MRSYGAGTRTLLSAALVDSGSGYCSQSEMPVHLGVPASWPGRIDVEITTMVAGARHTSIVRGIDPDQYRGRWLRVITTR